MKKILTSKPGIPFFILLLFLSLPFLPVGCGGKKPPRPAVPVFGQKNPATQRAYKVNGHWYIPIPDATGFVQRGIASWYGPKFHGKKTANGETYNMHAMTAAHKTLPIGTLVSVRNLNNGREAVVRINDRGPFVRGRIIDLSRAAAKKIGMLATGTAPVEITALERASSAALSHPTGPVFDRGDFTVQIGAFTEPQRAKRLKARLIKEYGSVSITPFVKNKRTFYRVRVGHFSSLATARAAESRLVNNGFPDAFAVSEDD